MLERLEPDPAGDADRLSDLRLPSNLFDPTGLWLVDLEARLPLAGEAGAPFSSSECSLLALLDVCTGACDARLPLRLDLEDAEALSDSEPESKIARSAQRLAMIEYNLNIAERAVLLNTVNIWYPNILRKARLTEYAKE